MTLPILDLEEVFRTEGVPEFTFVAPPNYAEILLDVRRVGKPVVLEGQSGTDTVDIAGIDPARLDQLLSLPKAHMIVDGYNVTKKGYGELSWTAAGRPAFVLPGPSGANNGMHLPLRIALWRDLADFLEVR